jgi:ribonuclease VapC
VIAVDSSALIAILRGEAEAGPFLHVILDASGCLLSSVILLETSIVLAGPKGGEAYWSPLDRLIRSARMEVVAHDSDLALLARQAFLRYGKGRHPAALTICDCASYALAKLRGVPLLYKGGDFSKTDLASAV